MGSNPVGITSKAPFSRRFFYCTPPLRHTNIIILDKYNDKLRLYNNLIHLKSFLPILLEKHYRPATGNSICSTHPCNYRNWSILKKNRIRLSKRRSQRKQRTFTYHGSAGRGKRNSNKFGPVLSSHHLCRRQDAPGNFWKQTFIITSAFSYLWLLLDTSPRQNANKFAFARGLFVSLQRIGGGSAIFACKPARLPIHLSL